MSPARLRRAGMLICRLRDAAGQDRTMVIHAHWHRNLATAPAVQPWVPPPHDERRVARQLCAALDRAIQLGLLEHADRVALTGAALAAEYPPLTERIARLRLRQGRVETALAVVDACASPSASLRMLRAVCLLQLGRGVEAQLELQQWCRRSSAPLEARVLLASMELMSGHAASAATTLQRNLRHLEHPRSLQLLAALAVLQDRAAPAQAWAARLHEIDLTHANAESGLIIACLGLTAAAPVQADHERHIEQLAVELIACEPAINLLVEDQHRRLDRAAATMLSHAIELALPDLSQRPAAMEALARLALLLEDHAAAMLWAERGLALHPRSASLTMLVQRLSAAASAAAATTVVHAKVQAA